MSEEDIVDGYVQDVEYGQYAMCMAHACLYVFPIKEVKLDQTAAC